MIYDPVVTLILTTLKKNKGQRVYLEKKMIVKLLRKWALKHTSPYKKNGNSTNFRHTKLKSP